MDSFSVGTEWGIESELIDLGAVSMTILRKLDGMAFRQALQHVLQQTSHPRVAVGGGGSERID